MLSLDLQDIEEVGRCSVDFDEVFIYVWLQVRQVGYGEFVRAPDELLELDCFHSCCPPRQPFERRLISIRVSNLRRP